jgi:hypothetical protein
MTVPCSNELAIDVITVSKRMLRAVTLLSRRSTTLTCVIAHTMQPKLSPEVVTPGNHSHVQFQRKG